MKTIRSRYVLFEVINFDKHQFSVNNINRALWDQLQISFGDSLSFKAGLWIIEWNSTNQLGILRFDHLVKEDLLASLAMITQIDRKKVIIHTRKIAGTIKKIKTVWKEQFSHIPVSKKP